MPTKVQMSVRIWAVWSGHCIFVKIYYSIHWFCQRATKAQISLRLCTGWSGPALSANCIKTLFVRSASYHNTHFTFRTSLLILVVETVNYPWKGVNPFRFREDPFLEGGWCAEIQTGSHRSRLTCKMAEIYKVRPFPLFYFYWMSIYEIIRINKITKYKWL